MRVRVGHVHAYKIDASGRIYDTAHMCRATQSPRSVFSWRELTQGVNDVSLNPIGGTGGSSPLLSMTSPAYSAIGNHQK